MSEDVMDLCNRECDPPGAEEDGLRRRQFLRLGATAGAVAGVATVGAACAPVGKTPWSARRPKRTKPLTDKEMKRYVAKLDKGLADIDKGTMLDGVGPADKVATAKLGADFAARDALAKKAVRTLYFTGMYNELPPESQRHPEMQKRLEQQMPEIDESLFTMTAYLGSQTADELGELQRTLKKNKDAGTRISESLNTTAKKMGVSLKYRAQARTMLTTGAWRLQSQPPSLIIDEYVKKVKKVAARQGQSEELKRYFASRMGDAAFWQHQQYLAQASPNPAPPAKAPLPGNPPPSSPSSVPPPAKRRAAPRPALKRQAADPERPPSSRDKPVVKSWPSPPHRPALEAEAKQKNERPGQSSVTAGVVLLSITGALSAVGTGLCFSPAWLAGAIILTVGAITLLIGLICLIVGAVKNANA